MAADIDELLARADEHVARYAEQEVDHMAMLREQGR